MSFRVGFIDWFGVLEAQQMERDQHKKGTPPEKQGGMLFWYAVKILFRPIKRGLLVGLLGLREVLFTERLQQIQAGAGRRLMLADGDGVLLVLHGVTFWPGQGKKTYGPAADPAQLLPVPDPPIAWRTAGAYLTTSRSPPGCIRPGSTY